MFRQLNSRVQDYIGLFLVGMILPSLLFLFWGIAKEAEKREFEQAKRSAAHLNDAIVEFRNYYSENVINRIQVGAGETIFSPQYKEVEGAIPVPATFALEVAHNLSVSSGETVKLYSRYPFADSVASSKDMTALDREALLWLETNPLGVFEKTAVENGIDRAYFGHPVIMEEGCVACHNIHPDSPKTDWKVGDLRGVLMISTTFSEGTGVIDRIGSNTVLSFLLIGSVAIMGVFLSIQSQIETLETQKRSLQAVSDSKSEFLANMSHEIRTPMNGIIGMTALLATTHLNAEQDSFVRAIDNSSQSLLTVLNDILDFSKIEAGKMDLELIPFDLRQTVTEVCKLFKPKVTEKGLEFNLHFDKSVPNKIIGDPNRLRQILSNLIGNGIKFTDEGSVAVQVNFQEMDNAPPTLHFSVSDSGIGISKDHVDRLFKSFSQADSSVTRRYGGTGLGLAISQKLVELMGGQIYVQSEEGVGSTFIFTLENVKVAAPCENVITHLGDDMIEPETKPNSSIEGEPEFPPYRILVVEDNPINQRIMKMLIKKIGSTPDIAEDGQKALHRLIKTDYDLVFLDVHMPNLSGFELVKQIRLSDQIDKRTKLVVMSAGLTSDESRILADLKLDGFIQKPFKYGELRQLILSLDLEPLSYS